MGKKTFITFFLNVLKNIQLKPKKPKKTQHPKWDFKLILGFLGFLGLNPPLYCLCMLNYVTICIISTSKTPIIYRRQRAHPSTVVPPGLQYRPSVDCLPPIPPPPNTAADFQVPNMFFLVIYDSIYRRFPIPPFFRQSRDGRYWGSTVLHLIEISRRHVTQKYKQTQPLYLFNVKLT